MVTATFTAIQHRCLFNKSVSTNTARARHRLYVCHQHVHHLEVGTQWLQWDDARIYMVAQQHLSIYMVAQQRPMSDLWELEVPFRTPISWKRISVASAGPLAKHALIGGGSALLLLGGIANNHQINPRKEAHSMGLDLDSLSWRRLPCTPDVTYSNQVSSLLCRHVFATRMLWQHFELCAYDAAEKEYTHTHTNTCRDIHTLGFTNTVKKMFT